MNKFNVRVVVSVILLTLTAILISFYQHSTKSDVSEIDISKIPKQIGNWQSKVIPVEQKVIDILQTPSVLINEFTNNAGKKAYLTIVYYKANRVEFHSPERCSVGQGSYIAEASRERIEWENEQNQLFVNKLIVKGERGAEVILYYFESGDFVTNSYFRLRLHMIANKLRNKSNSGALVKFSAPVDKDIEQTLNTIKEFAALAGPLLPQYLP